eukprot:GEZU01009394.1.p1 GENE.GEZU01009394.1~~GEZU01009394.1.p1  ORF type:complete len:690 (-),score=234.09 GEZU01009394.1:63-2132(-)
MSSPASPSAAPSSPTTPGTGEQRQTLQQKPRIALPKPKIATLSRKGSKVFAVKSSDNEDSTLEYEEIEKLCGEGVHLANQWSTDGTLFAVADQHKKTVTIYDVESGDSVQTINEPLVSAIAFSPSNTFMVTWRRPLNENERKEQEDKGNLSVWDVKTGKEVGRFVQKKRDIWPAIQWTSDEEMCARMTTNELNFYDGKTLKPSRKLAVPNIGNFSVAGKKSVAVFVPEQKSQPGSVTIYKYPYINAVVAQKSFFKAETANLHWNKDGSALLVYTHTEVDKTGKSYYGETNLYYLQADGKYDCRVALDKEGPIHDVQWNPKGKEFVVVYGFTPSKAALFDTKANPVFDFGTSPRNTARWNPQGRFLCLAGFGNLAGDMVFWDMYTKKQIGTANAHSAASYEWSPDGRYFMTATLFQRLKVDNGFKIWKYDGTLQYQHSFDELYQALWQPMKVTYPDRAPTPPPKGQKKAAASSAAGAAAGAGSSRPASGAQPAAAPTRYVPPHLRNQQGAAAAALSAVYKRQEEAAKVIPQKKEEKRQPPPAPVVLTKEELEALKKKKEEAKRRKKEEQKKRRQQEAEAKKQAAAASSSSNTGGEGAQQPPKEAASTAAGDGGDNDGDDGDDKEFNPAKKLRALNKKLREIDRLRQQQQQPGAKPLNSHQLQKINSEADIKKQIEEITALLAGTSATIQQ